MVIKEGFLMSLLSQTSFVYIQRSERVRTMCIQGSVIANAGGLHRKSLAGSHQDHRALLEV